MNFSKRLSNSILASSAFVVLLWCIKSAEILFSMDLHMFAVYPQKLSGALGIVTAPLIHGSLEHIFSNSLWFFARDAYHLGASGISHGIFFYLLVVGILRRDKSSVAIMMIAFFMYGGMTMSIFPREPGISFEYHLFGGISGALVALFWYRLDPKQQDKPYPWEQDARDIDDPIIGDEWRDTGGDTTLNEQTNPNVNAPPVRDPSQVNVQIFYIRLEINTSIKSLSRQSLVMRNQTFFSY